MSRFPSATRSAWLVSCPLPFIARHCPGCGGDGLFGSSGRFRVNANGRKLDVWLIYRCTRCDERYNLTVHERVSVAALQDRLQGYFDDDPALSVAIAADPQRLRGHRIVTGAPTVEVGGFGDVRICVTGHVDARLDRVLAIGLGVPRAEIARRVADGRVIVPEGSLSRPVRDGLSVFVFGE